MTVKLKMELKWTTIKRVVTIPDEINLLSLHYVVQAMFGFDDSHLWRFEDKAGNFYELEDFQSAVPDQKDGFVRRDPSEYTVRDALPNHKDVLGYIYDYGDGWIIKITRMANPRSDAIACVQTVGTNALDDIGGVGGLKGFIEELKACKLKGSEDDENGDSFSQIVEWGFNDPKARRRFLKGPSLKELTALLKLEVENALDEE